MELAIFLTLFVLPLLESPIDSVYQPSLINTHRILKAAWKHETFKTFSSKNVDIRLHQKQEEKCFIFTMIDNNCYFAVFFDYNCIKMFIFENFNKNSEYFFDEKKKYFLFLSVKKAFIICFVLAFYALLNLFRCSSERRIFPEQ